MRTADPHVRLGDLVAAPGFSQMHASRLQRRALDRMRAQLVEGS